jgi:hypothetical protein
MLCSFKNLLLLFSFHICTLVYSHVVLAPRTAPAYVPDPSSTSVVRPLDTPLTQVQDGSGASVYDSIYKSQSNSQPNTITTALLGGVEQVCLFGAAYTEIPCTYTKTADGPSLGSLDDQCMLWNSSCYGNRSEAIQTFFNDTLWKMTEKPCWATPALPECTKYESASILSEMAEIKNWMRTDQCLAAGAEFYGPGYGIEEPLYTCCGICWILAENVDVYYWPEPDSDNSCLSIVGNDVHPPLYDATKDSNGDYWACTAANATTSVVIPLGGPTLETVPTVQSIITIARMTSIGSLTFKESLVNPWSPPDCIGQTSATAPTSVSVDARALHASIRARGHSLVIPSSVTQKGGLLVSTVVSGQYTL